MTHQPDMLDWLATRAPASRASDPDTSVAAAERNKFVRRADRRAVIAALFHVHPRPLTDFHLATATRRKQTSIGKRRGELRDAGYVKDSGIRLPSDTGSPAIAWGLTESGVEEGRKFASEIVQEVA